MYKHLCLSRCLLAALLFIGTAHAQSPQEPSESTTTTPATESPASPDDTQARVEQHIEQLEEPLYSGFTERYILDDLKQLRTELYSMRAEMIEKVTDKELAVADKSMNYATNTVTYFFYLIAAATSLLVLVGWNSIRDIKEKVRGVADEEIAKLIVEYEDRLGQIETQLQQKSKIISRNQAEIERTNEIHSLWLRASQEEGAQEKIAIYDQILKLRPDDTEAITYKADAVLELNEPQWALNLCEQALRIDPENAHAYYQLACANVARNYRENALEYLAKAVELSDSYRDKAARDPAFEDLHQHEWFRELTLMDPA